MIVVTVDHAAVMRLAAPDGPLSAHLGRLAHRVADDARARCPHRSGALAASIHTEGPTADGAWAVVARVPYARLIEQRTPFLVPALRAVTGT